MRRKCFKLELESRQQSDIVSLILPLRWCHTLLASAVPLGIISEAVTGDLLYGEQEVSYTNPAQASTLKRLLQMFLHLAAQHGQQ